MEPKEYKKIINKLIRTIEKYGIPEKVKKWNKPRLRYDFKNYDDFHSFIFDLAKSYDKHTFIIDSEKEAEYMEKNKREVKNDRKQPIIKILKDGILYIKFFHYYNNYTGDWKKNIENWVSKAKPKIDKALEKNLNGIVIDLSEHHGGNMWPAVRSLGNIYGETTLLRFTSEKDWINMGKEKEKGGKFISDKLKFKKPIAVIVSEDTASSGEIIAATFKGRKNSFFIGDKTNKSGGFLSANQGFYIDKKENLELILTISLVETVDKKIITSEYLRVKKSDDAIGDSISKILSYSKKKLQKE